MSDFLALQELTAADLNERLGVFVRKTSDESVSSTTTLQNDNQLAAAVAANGIYMLFLRVSYNSGTTPDIKFGWTYPAGTTIRWTTLAYNTAGTFESFTLVETDVTAVGGLAAARGFTAFGPVVVGGTSGTLQLQWAQNTSDAGNTTVQAGSSLLLRRMD